MFVLIVRLWRISGLNNRRDDGTGFSLKNNLSVLKLCIRVRRTGEAQNVFLAYKKKTLTEDVQQNVYPVI